MEFFCDEEHRIVLKRIPEDPTSFFFLFFNSIRRIRIIGELFQMRSKFLTI